jgi:hypothetical protein
MKRDRLLRLPKNPKVIGQIYSELWHFENLNPGLDHIVILWGRVKFVKCYPIESNQSLKIPYIMYGKIMDVLYICTNSLHLTRS